MKESVVKIRDVLSSKTSKVEGKAVEQADTQGVKARDEEKGGFTKNSKTSNLLLAFSNSCTYKSGEHVRGVDVGLYNV